MRSRTIPERTGCRERCRVRVALLAALLAWTPLLPPTVQAGPVPEASGPACVPYPGMPCPGDTPSRSSEGGGSSSSSGSSSGGRSHKTTDEELILKGLQGTIDQMFKPNPAALQKVRETQMEGDRALQESQQAQQTTEEQRRQKATRDAEAARMRQIQELNGALLGMPGSGGPDTGVDLRPGGTSFFGLGGGTGKAPPPDPESDPMVVDLRHLRRATYMVQAVETSTTEQVPAALERALGAATGDVPDFPAGAAAPVLDEKKLQAFRKAYGEYAGTRAALARSEAALKEARARKKAAGGPEAEAAWQKAKAAYDDAKKRANGSREEAVRVLRALGAGKDPEAFRPPVPSIPALREETWLEMQKRMMSERASNDALTKRTQKELRSVVPPLKGPYRKMHEGVVLGFGTDNNDAYRMEKDGVSCFSGKAYASMNDAAERARAEGKEGVGGAVVVSFGTGKGERGAGYWATESGRVAGDHLTGGAISLNTPQARKALEEISGKEFDRLVAHSNGAVVAEALIREDRVRVNELNIVGGDTSLAKRGDYQEMVDSGKVKRVVVWVNLNDPVVWGTSVAPTELMSSGKDAVESLARKMAGAPAAGVEYRYMWGADHRIKSPPEGIVDASKRMGEAFIARHFVESSYYPGIANELGVDGYTLPARVRDGK